MKRFLVAVLITLFFLPSVGAQSAPEEVSLYGIDISISNDFPLGPYQSISPYNLGLSGRASMNLLSMPGWRPWVELDNNWWLVSPAWISWGTQINALLGLSISTTVATFEGIGNLETGVSVGYGGMFHIASAKTTGTNANIYSFIDQVVTVSIPTVLKLSGSNLGIIFEPRYLISPERSEIKQQIGVLLGMRIVFADQKAE